MMAMLLLLMQVTATNMLFSIDRGDLWEEPETFIGTGPFAYESWERGQEIHSGC